MLENALASDALEVAKIKAETKVLDEQAKELENEIEKRNESLSCLQQKIKQANLTVKRKQDQIDHLNQKLRGLLENTGVCFSEIFFIFLLNYQNIRIMSKRL